MKRIDKEIFGSIISVHMSYYQNVKSSHQIFVFKINLNNNGFYVEKHYIKAKTYFEKAVKP